MTAIVRDAGKRSREAQNELGLLRILLDRPEFGWVSPAAIFLLGQAAL